MYTAPGLTAVYSEKSGMRSDSTIAEASRAAGLLAAAGIITALGNLAFNVVVARAAGAPIYGELGALVVVPMIAGLLATGTQFTVARLAVSSGIPTRRLLRLAIRGSLLWLLLPAAMVALCEPIAAYLDLPSVIPVLLSAFAFAVVLIGAIPGGVLIGRRRFGVLAIIAVGTPIARITLGVILTRGPDPLDGALIGSLVPFIAASIVTLLFALRSHASAVPVPASAAAEASVTAEGSAGALIAAAIWAIWAGPTVFGRHWLPAASAGSLAAGQVLAGAAIYMSAPVLTAFFPTVVRGRETKAATVGLIGTAGVAVATSACVFAIGRPVLARVYGGQYEFAVPLAAALCVSAGAIAIANYTVWVLRGLRIQPVAVSLGVFVAVTIEIITATFSHGSGAALAIQPAMAAIGGVGGGVAAARLGSQFSSRASGDADGSHMELARLHAAVPDARGGDASA